VKYPPTGTPVDQRTYNEACRRIMDLESQVKVLDAKVIKYEKWFEDNAANLATHRIGGYFFDG
jgi:hypothetical protein